MESSFGFLKMQPDYSANCETGYLNEFDRQA